MLGTLGTPREPEGRAVQSRQGTHYEARSEWSWHAHLPPLVWMVNFIGLESMTDLMSFAAAADDPDIFERF